MEFWLILLVFLTIEESCSLAGTWWDKNKKAEKK